MKKVFVNCSNHPSKRWDEKQFKIAEQWGEVMDYPFPCVDATMTEWEVRELAEKCAEEILELNPAAVMCQGEFILTYRIVELLKEKEIPVLAACSERRTQEKILQNGATEKVSRYEFVKFRRY